jgi:hypothetical protein
VTSEASGWERHLQSALLGVLTLAVGGFGATTIQSSKDIAVLITQVENIQKDLHGKMSDRYTGNDHRAYSEFDSLRADNLRDMMLRNQDRIKAVEDRINGTD